MIHLFYAQVCVPGVPGVCAVAAVVVSHQVSLGTAVSSAGALQPPVSVSVFLGSIFRKVAHLQLGRL